MNDVDRSVQRGARYALDGRLWDARPWLDTSAVRGYLELAAAAVRRGVSSEQTRLLLTVAALALTIASVSKIWPPCGRYVVLLLEAIALYVMNSRG